MERTLIAASTLFAFAACTGPASDSGRIPDGVWVSGEGAVLTVENGDPVHYEFNEYETDDLWYRDGTMLRIGQARLVFATIGSEQFSGDFIVRGRTHRMEFSRTGN